MFNKDAKIEFDNWHVVDYLGAGASARIYKVTKHDESAALKVFDPGIFSNDAEAAERLKRQESLVGLGINHLAKILAIGQATIDGVQAPALLMELCPGSSLEKPEVQNHIDEKIIRTIISSVAKAAKNLMELGIAHRDIKPANIVYDSEHNRTYLLDTGVIQLINDHNDVSGYEFVGSKRYSPPEFIFRQEEKTTLGWTAVTFYQLGATLYELAFRRRPYHNFVVHAQLTEAIRSSSPDFEGIELLSPDIQRLLLLSFKRDWKVRLSALDWESFTQLDKPPTDSRLITQQQTAALIVDAASLSVAVRDILANTVNLIADRLRERALAAGYWTKLTFVGLSATIFAGKSSKTLLPALTISLDPAEDNAVILTLTRYSSGVGATNIRLFTKTEGEELFEVASVELDSILGS